MLPTDDEIAATIREAFRPLRCIVEILPNQQLSFQLIKHTKPTPIYTEPGIPIDVLRQDDNLRELLRSVSLLLEARGYWLNAWPQTISGPRWWPSVRHSTLYRPSRPEKKRAQARAALLAD